MSKILSILAFILSISSAAQETYRGIPNIRNFPRSEYNAGTQNWGICQDNRGFVYFANNDGLLCFNGVDWTLMRISSVSPLRSILVDSKNTLYVGLINDFGIVSMEDNKPSSYKSLKELIPEDFRDFDDIWKIHEVKEGIVFQCYKYIFLYSDNSIKIIEPEKRFQFSFRVGNKVLVHEPGVGLFELVDGELAKMPCWKEEGGVEISSIMELDDDRLLIGTTYNGIYMLEDGLIKKWKTPVNETLLNSRLYSAAELPGNLFAFGTILNGLIISDKDGNILYSLNNNWGIQNNTVLSLFVDMSQNLWLGLDNGIDYIEINSPLSYIGSSKIGTGYCCRVFEDRLYLGTNQGLYVRSLSGSTSEMDFKLVANTAGQVWSLDEFEGQLLCGHNLGTFIVRGTWAEKIYGQEGAWKFIALKDTPGFIIGGHYQGLSLYRLVNGKWQYYKKIDGFEESSRYMCRDNDNNIWVGHSGKGIFKLRLNEKEGTLSSVFYYNSENGLPSNAGNILFEYDDEIFVSTNNGIFEYDKLSNSFIVSERLTKLFENSGRVKTLVSLDGGDKWYITDREAGVITNNDDGTARRITVPFRKLAGKFVNEFEFVYPFNNENVFMGLEDGFAHFSPLVPKSYNSNYRTFITEVELPYLDSVLYLRDSDNMENYEFPFNKNSFRFHFAAPFFENEAPLEFSFYLDGFSEEWSKWSVDTYKDFTTLREGDYILKLKSRNVYGIEGEPDDFAFTILPPWRRSTQAYIIYLVLIILFAISVFRYILYRIKLAQKLQEEKYQQEIKEKEDRFQREALVAEKEIIDLRNEKLRSEMVYRDKELANQTMAIIEKNKFLKRINEDLNSIQDYVVAEAARNRIYGLVKKIRKEIDIKYQNKIFETYFDEANEGLFKRLKEKHPDLTPYDLRLCAFIRMNISTKEIATILNISYRGAEVSRYRLRKKMQLPREVNLSSYLSSF
jgi:DNA-binding CsgD family transcriptional regulator